MLGLMQLRTLELPRPMRRETEAAANSTFEAAVTLDDGVAEDLDRSQDYAA